MPRLHESFPALARSLPHAPLGSGPTPVRALSVPGGPAPVWLKHEGLYGTLFGGNKVRKLEWILPDVRRRGARTILTVGGTGTNHGLATALYAREAGLRCALALVDQPEDEHVRRQLERLRASGATLHFTRTAPRTAAAFPWLVLRHANLRAARAPYVLPAGGSSPVGALGYVEAALEIAHQVRSGELPEPSHAVCALGSGGTAAGLALGLRIAGLRTRLVAVRVNDLLRLDDRVVARLARRTARLLRERGAHLPDGVEPGPGDLTVAHGFLGPGYGHRTEEAEAARQLIGEREGVRLDPVYTAKAMAGLLALNARGAFGDGPVLFVHSYDALSGQAAEPLEPERP